MLLPIPQAVCITTVFRKLKFHTFGVPGFFFVVVCFCSAGV
jgi:hypothetical protein